MTVQERLEFIRAGYTRADIEAFESGEQASTTAQECGTQASTTAQDQEHGGQASTTAQECSTQASTTAQDQESDTPAWANALKASIDALTRVTQTRNALFDDMGDAADTASKAQRALATYLTGKEEK